MFYRGRWAEMFDKMMTRNEQMVLVLFLTAVAVGAGVMVWRATRPASLEMVKEEKKEVETAAHMEETTSRSLPTASASPPVTALTATAPPEPGADMSAALLPVVRSIRIELAGEILNPGIYLVPEGATLDEAVKEAGGYTEFVDTTTFNRLAHVIDGTKLTVPSKPRSRTDPRTGKVSIEMPAVVYNIPQYTTFAPQPARASGIPAAPREPASTPVQAAGSSAKININTASAAELETLPGIGPTYAAAIIAYRTEHPFRSVEELMSVHGIGPKRLEAIRNQVTVGR